MKGMINNTLYKLFEFLINIAWKLIHSLHKATAGLELKKTILCSSVPDFGDSAGEVFGSLVKMDEFKDYKFIWFCDYPNKFQHYGSSRVLVRKRIDNPVLRLVNLYHESTARCCIYTHQLIGNMYNARQLRINISHGPFGIKGLRKQVKSVERQKNYSTHIIHTFINDNQYVACGLPRNDRLFDDRAATRKKLRFDSFNQIIIWLPTFKHYKPKGLFHWPRNDFNVQKENDITLQRDSAFYPEVEKALKAHNTLLVIKYHPSQDMEYVSSQETGNIKIVTDHDLSDFGVPLYSFLGATDALITDFSSVCYDYLLINKPLGFDITDLDLYDVGVENPEAYMPGEKIKSVTDFCNFILKVTAGEDHYEEARKKLLNELHVNQDNKSTERVVEFILSQISHANDEASKPDVL